MTRREEARDTATSPARLQELIHLPGDRGDCDSDAGWCREYVAANPSAWASTLAELAEDTNDFLVRKLVAANPAAQMGTVERLAGDENELVANAALERLGRQLRRTTHPPVLALGIQRAPVGWYPTKATSLGGSDPNEHRRAEQREHEKGTTP
ncbi:hypothetical protein [Arthrobacter sp. A2-55]|uniref:hypothetical protein n=1 Tax=Arthrobacter sp. A2-55 TaxID=2897337 RepID=UPI0021CD9899|nr:hypothetical protein [Arthrobacter sp. A2-55]MCU6479040.1 hypothetical protein [Arthrobacter sp. A2-55]